ncbi:MAG: CinA family protein [Candidatus Omnitrophica bacterium]|nr:CinA family protein [Candidatus Omnitrophota bacterium]
MRIEQKIAKILLTKQNTLAIAESCTGGLLAHRFTNIPGSSAFFWLGIIAYDNKAKVKLLKIPPLIIKKHDAVSLPVVKFMAQNVRKILNTHWGIGITGIAGPAKGGSGPSGGTNTKPVGLVYIAVASRQKTLANQYYFKGTRLAIKNQAANKALEILLCALS